MKKHVQILLPFMLQIYIGFIFSLEKNITILWLLALILLLFINKIKIFIMTYPVLFVSILAFAKDISSGSNGMFTEFSMSSTHPLVALISATVFFVLEIIIIKLKKIILVIQNKIRNNKKDIQ